MTATPLRQATYIILGMLIGALVGHLLGTNAAPLGEIGKIFVQLIRAVAAPLLFFAIIEAILTTNINLRSAVPYIFVVIVNMICAIVIGLTVANVFIPGANLPVDTSLPANSLLASVEGKKISFIAFVEGIIPDSIIEPFLNQNILGVVFLSVIIGAAIRSLRQLSPSWMSTIELCSRAGYQISEKLILWLVTLTPFAVFGVMAKTIGEFGFSAIYGVLSYLGAGLLGLSLQIFVVYMLWLVLVVRIPLLKFWRAAWHPVVYSFGVNSSLATLPLTLASLDRLGVSKESSRLGACIGTNLNNDGILLYEAMAVIIVAQAFGMQLDLGAQVTVALLCVMASMGIAGVPEAGIIALAVILGTLGLPTEILPLLLTVDWILARYRSVTNVVADMTTSMVIDSLKRTK